MNCTPVPIPAYEQTSAEESAVGASRSPDASSGDPNWSSKSSFRRGMSQLPEPGVSSADNSSSQVHAQPNAAALAPFPENTQQYVSHETAPHHASGQQHFPDSSQTHGPPALPMRRGLVSQLQPVYAQGQQEQPQLSSAEAQISTFISSIRDQERAMLEMLQIPPERKQWEMADAEKELTSLHTTLISAEPAQRSVIMARFEEEASKVFKKAMEAHAAGVSADVILDPSFGRSDALSSPGSSNSTPLPQGAQGEIQSQSQMLSIEAQMHRQEEAAIHASNMERRRARNARLAIARVM